MMDVPEYPIVVRWRESKGRNGVEDYNQNQETTLRVGKAYSIQIIYAYIYITCIQNSCAPHLRFNFKGGRGRFFQNPTVTRRSYASKKI